MTSNIIRYYISTVFIVHVFSKALACKSGHEFEMYYETKDRGKQYKLVLKLLSETYTFVCTYMYIYIDEGTVTVVYNRLGVKYRVFVFVFYFMNYM